MERPPWAIGQVHNTDRGSHFGNILLEQVWEKLMFTHSFNMSYVAWTNRQIEVANSRILVVLKALTSELRLQLDE
eukprot:snap_masked-scaffold_3-processed-gene-10.39-mRNA-1 protein AED:1.00 eAED:1.00 QI:0/-1/0/0/-1/1/1/0/74